MRIRTLVCLVLGSTVAALLGACAATGDAPIESANSTGAEMVKPVASQQPQSYRFYIGDELSVNAVNRRELSVIARVDPHGYIAYPYLGQVYVKDLNAQEVAARLMRGLQEGGYYNRVVLNVSLSAAKEQFVYILGEVKRPGPVAITGSISLVDAIGKAGGQTHDSEMSTVLWIRGSQSPPGVVKLDLKTFGDPRGGDPKIPNLALIPGDVLYIPDSVIVSVERAFTRWFNILRTVLVLEQGIVLYDSVERVLSRTYSSANTGGTTIVVTPLK